MENDWKLPGGVTAAAGFQAGTTSAGIKYENKKDVAIIYSDVPAVAAGVFTTNKVKAAPVLLDMERIAGGKAQAIVVNSGNANACNGEQGMNDTVTMSLVTANALGIPQELVLVASTGVIGQQLPMDKVQQGILQAAAAISTEGGSSAAKAIMTTDTFSKEAAREIVLNGKRVVVGGMAKGSGMIHPDMATLLCFITTDAAISPTCLQQALKYAVSNSFNMVTVDRDTSTNDTVLMLANGIAGNPVIEDKDDEYILFRDALTDVCVSLAMDIAKDGEGATKLIQVEVCQALTLADARLAAKAVAGSNLLKAAIFGRDANWGRILCAAGYSGADFNPETVDVFLGDELVARKGCAVAFSEERALSILNKDTVLITIDFHMGEYSATAWGCDLTYDYVRINGDYRT